MPNEKTDGFQYLPRVVDSALEQKLSEFSAVYVRGPKWCGKTSTCEQQCASELKLRDPDVYARSAEAAQIRPSLLLHGEQPRLIDEWQRLPVLWDAVVNEADNATGAPGLFMFTGSATPPKKKERTHTGTGRIARLDMLPMSLYESSESSCSISLAGLLDGPKSIEGVSTISIEDYAHIICRGGWPAPIAAKSQSTNLASEYIKAICESDLEEASDSAIDPDRARALLHSIARNCSQEASNTTILADVKSSGIGMTEPTLRIYAEALRRLFVLQEVKAWAPALRSRTPLRSAKAWHLCDPSLAAAALDVNEQGLLRDFPAMGLLFESLCVRDLRVYSSTFGGDVYRYRDKSNLEVDCILRMQDGRWAGIEVKLGGAERIEEGAGNLKALAEKVDHDKMGHPAFLMVLTGGEFAYTRNDGVHVVPLGCLMP